MPEFHVNSYSLEAWKHKTFHANFSLSNLSTEKSRQETIILSPYEQVQTSGFLNKCSNVYLRLSTRDSRRDALNAFATETSAMSMSN